MPPLPNSGGFFSGLFGKREIPSSLSGGTYPTRSPDIQCIGTVKWFNASKGYGFITPQEGGCDVLVQIAAIQAAGLKGLNDGQRVSYDLVPDRAGPIATNLKLVFSDDDTF